MFHGKLTGDGIIHYPQTSTIDLSLTFRVNYNQRIHQALLGAVREIMQK